jgi:predicted amidohydrolase
MISALAKEQGVWLAGRLLESEAHPACNTRIVIDPAGELQASYHKMHLFGLMAEARWLSAGQCAVTADWPWARRVWQSAVTCDLHTGLAMWSIRARSRF